MTKRKTKIGETFLYIVLVLVLVGVCGAIAFFTNGFTSDFKTFYLECNGKHILSETSGFVIEQNEAMQVDVRYTFGAMNKEASGYGVKIVPNKIEGKDFDIVCNGETKTFQSLDDLTVGFDIFKSEKSFKIKAKGDLNAILGAVQIEHEINDCTKFAYTDMFTLVVSSYNSDECIKLNFTLSTKLQSVELDKEVISF